MNRIPIPPLPTLTQTPSWTNRAGRIDRSACCELTINAARKLAQRAGLCDPVCKCIFTITARELHELHSARNPFVVKGDHRTAKSNVMKVRPSFDHFRRPAKLNPNAGACREKLLGLPEDWQQQLILITPSRSQRERATRNSHQSPTPSANLYFLRCPRCHLRRRKLLLSLCTLREIEDATLAQSWLRSYDGHIRPHMTDVYELRTKLIERYAPLFQPRSLACRKCFGVRYGEVKLTHQDRTARNAKRDRRRSSASVAATSKNRC